LANFIYGEYLQQGSSRPTKNVRSQLILN